MSCFPTMFADSFVPKTYKTLHVPVALKEKHLQQLLAQVSWPVKVLEVDPPVLALLREILFHVPPKKGWESQIDSFFMMLKSAGQDLVF